MSSISSLQAELSRQQSINHQLRSELAELGSGVSSAYRRMENCMTQTQTSLSGSAKSLESSHERVVRAYEVQLEIDRMYARFKNMEMANKKIREANNKIYYDFHNYNTVRKIVQGMLDNMNLSMISDDVIYKSIEKEHLKVPDYWLTTVLLGVMAWKNDDKALADKSIEIAMRLDRKNAAIFYMLFNIRMGRDDAALKWFNVYQECELTGEDEETFLMLFSLLNQTVKDKVDDRIRHEAIEFISKVISANARDEGYDEQGVIDTIEDYLLRMKSSDSLQLNMLKRCLQDYDHVADMVACAANNVTLLQFVLDVRNVSVDERNAYLDQFIQEEVEKPNTAEKEVYDTIEYNEIVIRCGGDVEAAKAQYAELTTRRAKKLNLISRMICWIYDRKDNESLNPQVRKNMFALTIGLQTAAVEQYVDDYRAQESDIHPVVIGDYVTETDFGNRSGESEKIRRNYEQERDQQLKSIKFTLSILGAIVACAGVAGLFFVGPMTLVASGVGALMIVYNVLSNSRQKKHILETCDLNINSKESLMDQLFGEYAEMQRIYADYDSYADRLLDELDRF